MKASERRRKVLEEAWVGDAVLSLYARGTILREGGSVDNTAFERMTSNRFLAAIGEPSEVEAAIGRIYQTGGIEAAFAWIETSVIPLYLRQEEKRIIREGGRPASGRAPAGPRKPRSRTPD
jgi:hypothetical protein